MTVYPGVNRAQRRRELDRRTWAESTLHVFEHEPLLGTGFGRLHTIDFLTVFEGQPIFHWAVELREDSPVLVEGSFPQIQAGIASWTIANEPIENGVTLYSGCQVWMGAKLGTSTPGWGLYLYRFRFGFEGMVFKNVSTLR